ncbi:MAG: hypothetical protein HY513_00375 [Candidatus Aenigmarchaeota archaeon]|nr:hypothetical protein [Candidatus Aenigmarchaeota archaeon]
MLNSKKEQKINYHLLPLLAIVFALSWQFAGSNSGTFYQSQSYFPAYSSFGTQDPLVYVQTFPASQFRTVSADTGPFIVHIPQPAAPYIPPTSYPSLIASVIDWGWGPIFVDSVSGPAWADYFHNRDYYRYYGNKQEQSVKKRQVIYRTYTQDIFAGYKQCAENGPIVTCTKSVADP